MILECGHISRPQPTITRKLEKIDREKLGLPKFRVPSEKFKTVLLKALETS